MSDTATALALCGGGGKGAFQIGVWKALEERNILQNIKAISGTSVGALNAVLFALGDFKKAKNIWYKISNDVLKNGRQELKDLMGKIPLDKIYDSGIDVYVTVLNVHTHAKEYIHLNTLPVNEIIDALLASSALPAPDVLYKTIIHKNKYLDGGMTEHGNTPIEPLYEHGFRDIYVVSLNHNFNITNIHKKILKDSDIINATQQFPDCKITVIHPLHDLGGFMDGTLNFTQPAIRDRMICGYSDAKKLLNEGMVYYMKNQHSRINIEIRNQMIRLFKSPQELEEFIKVTNFSAPDLLPTKTMGGKVWYENIVEIFGWKVQQHKVPFAKSHYRILDSNNVRRAYVFNPEDILQALCDYEATNGFNGKPKQ